MTIWIIEPCDPLIARDGRPFEPSPGARARSLPFPFPSTTAGGARTRAGQVNGAPFNAALVPEVKALVVRGPLLAEESAKGEWQLLVPAPGDALLFSAQEKQVTVKQLLPIPIPPGAQTDLPPSLSYHMGLAKPDPHKPAPKPPRFWYWDQFQAWLSAPQETTCPPAALGHSGPQPDRRMHVAIDPETRTGEEGMLFMTSGLTFWHEPPPHEEDARLSAVRRLALVLEVEGYDANLDRRPGHSPLGGERRLLYWREAGAKEPPFPPRKPPDEIVDAIAAAGVCRVILLTPAYFERGWMPDVAAWAAHGVTPELVAACVGKPDVISGWDLLARGPKAARRLAPAGSVYFLRLPGTEAQIRQWVNHTWLTCLSEDSDGGMEQASGFGLAALGVAGPFPPVHQKEEV